MANQLIPQFLSNRYGSLPDPDWRVRGQAFYTLWQTGKPSLANLLRRWPERSDALKLALIGLLERETAFTGEYRESVFKRTSVPLGEAYGEYFGDVIEAVTSLKDVRSLNAPIGVIHTSDMATRTLAEFGPAALDRVVAVFNSGDARARQSATRVLVQMLDPHNAPKVSDPVSREKIKDTLIRAAKGESPWVRLVSIEGLAKLGDADVIPLIQNIARNDPSEEVRKAANEALKKPK